MKKEHESVELIKEYRKYLHKLLGKQLEELSYVEYDAGWYRHNWAQRFPDGSCGNIGLSMNAYRKKDFIEQIKELKGRTK